MHILLVLILVWATAVASEEIEFQGTKIKLDDDTKVVRGVLSGKSYFKTMIMKIHGVDIKVLMFSGFESRSYSGLCLVWNSESKSYDFMTGYPVSNISIIQTILQIKAQ